MARIRSIKPEFWSSPNLPEDPWARLLFVAMWNWADDNGVGTAIPRELLGFAFPNDEHLTVVDLRRMLVEIRRVFGVKFYEVAGRPYYSIPSWEDHQKFDRRSKGKHPGPEEEESQVKWMKSEDSTESHESTSSARSDSVAGTGEQGNRGTEEQSLLSDADASDRTDELFDQLWDTWPSKQRGTRKKSGSSFRTALKSVGGVRSASTILDAAEMHANVWRTWPASEQQFIPQMATWLNQERWTLDAPEQRAVKAAQSGVPAQDIRNGIVFTNGKPRIGGPNGMTREQYDEWREGRAAAN